MTREARSSERGVALLMTMAVLSLLLVMAIGIALVASVDLTIAANHTRSLEALYATDAGLARVAADVASIDDWNLVLSGAATSPHADGAPTGVKARPDGASLDLGSETNLANCNHPGACTDGELDQVTKERPWGPNNPRWRPFAYGPLRSWLPPGSTSLFYVVAWVADDPSETDADPARDGGAALAGEDGVPSGAGLGVVQVRVAAFGPVGAHRAIQATLVRGGVREGGGRPPVRVEGWRELQ